MSVFRGSFEAGRSASYSTTRTGTMQITGVAVSVRCVVSRRFRSFQVINRSRVHKRTTYGSFGLGRRGLYTGAEETGPSGRTGDYFARIAPSSHKAAPLICLGLGDRGLAIITCDPLLAAGTISPAAANHHEETERWEKVEVHAAA